MTKRADFYIAGRKLFAKPYHYVESGLDNVYLLNGVSKTKTAYGVMVKVDNINGLHRAIGLHIVEKTESMHGGEFRFLRKLIGRTQVELADEFGVSDQTIANYEKKKARVPRIADDWIRVAYLFFILPDDTRVAAMKTLLNIHSESKRLERLPAQSRRQIGEKWIGNESRSL